MRSEEIELVELSVVVAGVVRILQLCRSAVWKNRNCLTPESLCVEQMRTKSRIPSYWRPGLELREFDDVLDFATAIFGDQIPEVASGRVKETPPPKIT